MNLQKKQKGFTLIEVLISIVIIGIMSAVSIISYKGYVQMSNESATEQELAQIAQALEVAALDGSFNPDNDNYTYAQLAAFFQDVTGYELPFTAEELVYSNSHLYLTKRDVTVDYDFTNKTFEIQ